ncbi:hypothetical protein ACOSQ3_004038 [Xanthoceras sorbifolium]
MKTKKILLPRHVDNGLYHMSLAGNDSKMVNRSCLLSSHAKKNQDCSYIACNKSRNCSTLLVFNSAAINVALAAKSNFSLWHAKLAHSSPIDLQKLLKTLHFPFKIHSGLL